MTGALSTSASPAVPARFAFIDGLRGIGSLAVLLGHLVSGLEMSRGELGDTRSWASRLVFLVGGGAVEMFFVLSGFVIAHSIRDLWLTPASIARFIVRRQVRLDPVYWASLLVAVLDLQFLHPMSGPPATLANVAVNGFYLPWILRRRVLLQPSWTLCLEVQFYVLFILLLWAAQSLRRVGASHGDTLLVAGLVLGSLSARLGHPDAGSVLFVDRWFLFGVGALVQWSLTGRSPRWVASALVGAMLLAAAATGYRDLIFGGTAAAAVYFAGRRGHLSDWLNQWPIRFLGRISYSLYLIHVLLIAWVFEVGERMTGLSSGKGVAWAVATFALNIAAAYMVHRLIERPSIRLAAWLKTPQTPSA